MSIKAQDEIRSTSITLIPMQLQDLISKERAPVCKLWGPFQDVDYPPQKSCLQCHSAYLVVSQSSKAPHRFARGRNSPPGEKEECHPAFKDAQRHQTNGAGGPSTRMALD